MWPLPSHRSLARPVPPELVSGWMVSSVTVSGQSLAGAGGSCPLEFVLQHYVTVGVEELDVGKLSPLLRLRYHDSLADAFEQLGPPAEINQMFTGFQKYLYVKVP